MIPDSIASPDAVAYLNGEFLALKDARVSVLDRGFIFGDGIYEVIPVYNREPLRLAGHLRRLRASLESVRMSNPHDDTQWQSLFREVIQRSPHEDQALYLQVTRGIAKRDHAFPAGVTPTVFIMSNQLSTPTAQAVSEGVKALTLPDNRWLRCDIKSTSLLPNILLRQAAVDAGCAEAVMVRDGFLTEGAASNIFVVKNGTLLCPPKSHLILPGITYDVVLDLARKGGIPVEIRAVPEAELRGADEVWLSSSTREVLAITTLDGKPVGTGKPGALFKRIHALFQEGKRPRLAHR
ncbi:MAG: D-amino acid aminotransferase [Betaproteobacteria bacterium]|nr:D-amino acid aminotransferase [Betaproteobacteria bacterium]